MKKRIIDVCCGSKMFWFDKENEDVLFMDNRELESTLCDGRSLKINPKEDLKLGFNECFRVLKENGVLIFKWNEEQIKLKDVLATTDLKPLFGNKRAKTHWVVFMK